MNSNIQINQFIYYRACIIFYWFHMYLLKYWTWRSPSHLEGLRISQHCCGTRRCLDRCVARALQDLIHQYQPAVQFQSNDGIGAGISLCNPHHCCTSECPPIYPYRPLFQIVFGIGRVARFLEALCYWRRNSSNKYLGSLVRVYWIWPRGSRGISGWICCFGISVW